MRSKSMFKHTSNSFDSRKMPQLTFNNILRYALKEIQNLWDELIVRLDIWSGSEVICWTRLLARSRVLAETLLPSLETTSLALLTKTTLFFYIRSVKIQRFKRERERERGRERENCRFWKSAGHVSLNGYLDNIQFVFLLSLYVHLSQHGWVSQFNCFFISTPILL